jgi:hypothetical protein
VRNTIKLTDPEIERIWKFVNHYFGYCYPTDFIPFIHFERFDLAMDMLSDEDLEGSAHNKYEIERAKGYTKEQKIEVCEGVDGIVLKQSGVLHVWIFPDRIIGNSRNNRGLAREFLRKGYTLKDYTELVLMHELAHILEHITDRQLLVSPKQDIEMFINYRRKTEN